MVVVSTQQWPKERQYLDTCVSIMKVGEDYVKTCRSRPTNHNKRIWGQNFVGLIEIKKLQKLKSSFLARKTVQIFATSDTQTKLFLPEQAIRRVTKSGHYPRRIGIGEPRVQAVPLRAANTRRWQSIPKLLQS
jgi:hypothetical protein